jgi:TonB family protein
MRDSDSSDPDPQCNNQQGTARDANPDGARNERGLSLLLEAEPWHRAFLHRVGERLRSAELPPLELTCKPVHVEDIWAAGRFNPSASTLSLILHALFVAAILIPIGSRSASKTRQAIVQTRVTLAMPNLAPAAAQAEGGGGGGDRSAEPASKGELPELAMEQKAPPVVIRRNETPKLPVAPTVIVPPEIPLPATVDMAQLGDPWSIASVPSNGPGTGSGIGDGRSGGVGAGDGPGVGPGTDGGFGGGEFNPRGWLSPPEVAFKVDPEYSEEARKAKYQGTVVIRLTVNSDGTSSDIEVITPLGMGLDEKAVEAVRRWRFRPARRGMAPVATSAQIEVTFRLL